MGILPTFATSFHFVVNHGAATYLAPDHVCISQMARAGATVNGLPVPLCVIRDPTICPANTDISCTY